MVPVAGNQPVRPLPAATVILIRMGPEEPLQVFLTKRPETMRFLPGHCVFPGGKLEAADARFPEECLYGVARESLAVDVSYYVAAARELFEEVGVLLYRGAKRDIDAAAWRAWRSEVGRDAAVFAEIFRECGWRLDLAALRYFGHRVTPKTSPYRYNTRFFLALLPEGQEPEPDPVEIADGFWIEPQEALRRAEKGELKFVRPTRSSLTTLAAYRGGPFPVLPDRPEDGAYRTACPTGR